MPTARIAAGLNRARSSLPLHRPGPAPGSRFGQRGGRRVGLLRHPSADDRDRNVQRFRPAAGVRRVRTVGEEEPHRFRRVAVAATLVDGELERERRASVEGPIERDRLDAAERGETAAARPDDRPGAMRAGGERTLDDRSCRPDPVRGELGEHRFEPRAIHDRDEPVAVAHVVQHGGDDVVRVGDDRVLDGERRELGELRRRARRERGAHESDPRHRQHEARFVGARDRAEARDAAFDAAARAQRPAERRLVGRAGGGPVLREVKLQEARGGSHRLGFPVRWREG